MFFSRLTRLPGNLLRDVIGVLPHDDAARGTSTGMTDDHFQSWCESMGGTVKGGKCVMSADRGDYEELHSAVFSYNPTSGDYGANSQNLGQQ